MRNLPFVVKPKRAAEKIQIGNEESGIFEIERKGYLTVGEKAAYQQVIVNKDGAKALRDLVETVSKGANIPLDKAADLVGRALQAKKLSAKEEKLLNDYTAQFIDVLEVFKREATHSQLIMATILLVSRVDPEWSFDDTARLDAKIIEDLAVLFQAEEQRSIEELKFDAQEAGELAKADSETTSPATEGATEANQPVGKPQDPA